ncbi:hypothetical protein K432DRAFT_377900 [Lepidopterella palustris CBS 459.81]|uniref:Alpha N-terminal protein methyltransferase 1 n=1 Tax=Lepidopterella palustris CBS 459.81 TaxID=1314670 RepID=A0A8E2JJX8_9PEZI|nr:hypothetical protein K432DRAFT_377900 [Lepidopterella palustris CBS 459.81]
MDMTIDPDPTLDIPADASIDQSKSLAYWNSVPSTVNGMLGGYPHISRIDLQGSANFLAKLRRQISTPHPTPLPRAADCGAGIGRITKGFLVNVAARVDIVEPVKKFTDELVAAPLPTPTKPDQKTGEIGQIYNFGLQDWAPEPRSYNLIWNQWCLGHLTDTQLVTYLRRCKEGLAVKPNPGAENEGAVPFAGAWIVVKENMSTDSMENDIFDEQDSSVTRTDAKFRALFKEAGLRLVSTELQKGFPRDLYPVRIYALRAE